MSLSSKVSWKNGMFLLPQHFQQADRSLESSLQLRLHGPHPLNWGVLYLQLNEAAVAQGRVELQRCQAILPDGTTLDVPDGDIPPPSRVFQIPATASSVDIYLTVPARRPRTPVATPDTNRADIRFIEQIQEVPDEFDPAQAQSIDILSKNLRFVFSGEPLDGLVALKVAEVYRTTEGIPMLRRDYIPPCLRINSSPYLDRLGREILGVVAARSRSLTEERRRFGADQIDFNPTTLMTFWFLYTLNQHAPVLQHLLDTPGTHPSVLYEALLSLAGALSTFALKNATDLPMYNHEAIAESYVTLDRWLREILAHLFQTRYEIIPLVKKDAFWIGHIADSELRASGIFILAATGDLAPAEIVGKLPNACKIAEIDGIERLVRTHVGGVRIQHLVRPPNLIPIRNDAVYFRIMAEGPDWERVRATGQLAAYIPTWLPGIRLELIGIRGGPGQ